jgi:hypothetical protein
MTGTGVGDRGLRLSLLGGAVYDLALGILIVTRGDDILSAFGRPVDACRFYFLLGALPLFLLPALYVSAATARETEPFRLAVLWARGGGGLALVGLTAWTRPGVAWLFVVLGVLDLLWAGLHGGLWRRRG